MLLNINLSVFLTGKLRFFCANKFQIKCTNVKNCFFRYSVTKFHRATVSMYADPRSSSRHMNNLKYTSVIQTFRGHHQIRKKLIISCLWTWRPPSINTGAYTGGASPCPSNKSLLELNGPSGTFRHIMRCPTERRGQCVCVLGPYEPWDER